MGRRSATARKRMPRKVRAAKDVSDEPIQRIELVQSGEHIGPIQRIELVEPVALAEPFQQIESVQQTEPVEQPAPAITAMDVKARLGRITLQWQALAERRLRDYTELYRSGRWQRYYTEERFIALMNDVAQSVSTWRKLAKRLLPEGDDKSELRLSA